MCYVVNLRAPSSGRGRSRNNGGPGSTACRKDAESGNQDNRRNLEGSIPTAEVDDISLPRQHEAVNRLFLDGEKIRYEDNHGVPSAVGGSWPRRRCAVTSDGEITKSLIESPPDFRKISGYVQWERFEPIYVIDLAPVLMAFRGNTNLAWHSFSELRPNGRRLSIDGVSCTEYSFSIRFAESLVWLDPTRNFNVRRAQHDGAFFVNQYDIAYRKHDVCDWVPESWVRRAQHDGAFFVNQYDIAYRKHDVCDWVPESWVVKRIDPTHGVTRTTRYEIRDLRINQILPAELFDISFPVGTVVSETRSGKFREYVIQPDGSEKPWNPVEHVLPKMKPTPEPWFRINRWVFRGASAFVIISVLAGLAFRLRQSRTPTPRSSNNNNTV
jgi:hypothetical protein